MSGLNDAINSYAARAADKAASLTAAEREAAAEKKAQRLRDESVDAQIKNFISMVHDRIDSLIAGAGSSLPEIRNVGSNGAGVTYALCPEGEYSGRDTLTFEASPLRDVVTASMPAPLIDNMFMPPIIIGTHSFQSLQLDWIDSMLALWLERAQP